MSWRIIKLKLQQHKITVSSVDLSQDEQCEDHSITLTNGFHLQIGVEFSYITLNSFDMGFMTEHKTLETNLNKSFMSILNEMCKYIVKEHKELI